MIANLKRYPTTKDSGVEWLGEVPAHWEVLRLKAWLDVNQLVLPEDTDPDYTFDYVDIGSVATGSSRQGPNGFDSETHRLALGAWLGPATRSFRQ